MKLKQIEFSEAIARVQNGEAVYVIDVSKDTFKLIPFANMRIGDAVKCDDFVFIIMEDIEG